MSGLARPWRVPALIGALEAEPESVPELLVAAQRFFHGHPFANAAYEGLFGGLRRARVDRRYREVPAGQGLAVFDLETRRVRVEARGVAWRRAGWLYYHDGEAFTRRRVQYRVPESWVIEGTPADRIPQLEWNDGGPEPFEHLFGEDD
jgi:hypothetical protein